MNVYRCSCLLCVLLLLYCFFSLLNWSSTLHIFAQMALSVLFSPYATFIHLITICRYVEHNCPSSNSKLYLSTFSSFADHIKASKSPFVRSGVVDVEEVEILVGQSTCFNFPSISWSPDFATVTFQMTHQEF